MVDKIVPIKIEVNKQKKEVLPQTVPLSDDTWQRLADIDKYKRGIELSKKCQKALEEAEQKIKQVSDNQSKTKE